MDAAVIVAIAAAGVSALGVGITLIVLVVRGGFLLGRLVTQVEGLTAAVGDLRTEMQQSNQDLRTEMQQNNQDLRTEMQQNNQDLRTEMQQNNQDLRTEMRQNNQDLRTEMRQNNQDLRTEMQQNNQTLTAAINELRAEVQQSN